MARPITNVQETARRIANLKEELEKIDRALWFFITRRRKILSEIRTAQKQQKTDRHDGINKKNSSAALKIPVEKLGLDSKTSHLLREGRILTLEHLTVISEEDLMHIPHIGRKSIRDIKEMMERFGVALAG